MAKRKEYSKEFKEEAVRLAQENGNVSETARNSGPSSKHLAQVEN